MLRKAIAALIAVTLTCATVQAAPVIGIGPIVNRFDSSSESLGLYYFLQSENLKAQQSSSAYSLAEGVRDADIVVTGSIDSSFKCSTSSGHLAIGVILMICGFVPGLIYMLTAPTQLLRYTHDVDLRFYRRGLLVDTIRAGVGGAEAGMEPGVLSGAERARVICDRAPTMAPLWRHVRARLNALASEESR